MRFSFIFALLVSTQAFAQSTKVEPSPSPYDEFGNREIIRLLHDQPNFFIMGHPLTKVQLSFKAKVFQDSDLYFAYTQKIFWDIFSDSSPFKDITYNPMLFYRWYFSQNHQAAFDLIGIDHESNGKKGSDSRSWNRVGIRYQVLETFSNDMKGIWSFRTWVPYIIDTPNSDIIHYRGLYEIGFTLTQFLGPLFDLGSLSLKLYSGGVWGLNPIAGGQELTFVFKEKHVGFLGNTVIQLFQGYGENMLEYNQKIFGLRAGVGI